jgi:lipoprotein-anchoring transpeptidase ErfK/SrfK
MRHHHDTSPSPRCLVALAALLAIAVGAGATAALAKPRPSPHKPRHCSVGTKLPLGTARLSLAAVARRPTTAFRQPGRGVLARFDTHNVNGVPTVFSVVGAVLDRRCTASWFHVELPMRPNGVTGYVRADAVAVARVRTRIVVDVSRRELSFFKNGRLVLRSRTAVGASATPTPLGRYYVNQRLVPADPGGPFGPGAIGISAFSNVLTGWTQGGPVAIHGTNEPWSIGHAVSNGCIRVPNAVIRRLFASTPAGTPVFIHR